MKLTYRFLIAVLAMAIPLRATTTYYLGNGALSSFNSAVGLAGLSQINATIDFSASNGFLGPVLSNANGTGVSFLGLDGSSNPINLAVSGGKLQQTADSQPIEVAFPGTNVYAFGFVFNYTGSATFVNWQVGSTNGASNDGAGTQVTIGTADLEFIGVVSDVPLTTPIFLSRQGGGGTASLVIDNFTAFSGATQTQTPEPGTLALIGSGLVMLSVIRRRVQKARRPS